MLVVAFIASNDQHALLTCTSDDGVNWKGNFPVHQDGYAVGMTTLHDRLVLGFRSADGEFQLLTAKSDDGVRWTHNFPVYQAAPLGVSMTTFEDRAYMAFTSNDGKEKILICSSPNGEVWTDNDPVEGQLTSFSPGIAAFDRKLVLAFEESGSAVRRRQLDACTSDDGSNWSNNVQVGAAIAGQPGLAAFRGQVYVAFNWPISENTPDNKTNNLTVYRSSNGLDWSRAETFDDAAGSPPSLAVFRDRLYLAYGQYRDWTYDSLVIRSSGDGTNWSSPKPILDQTTFGCALGVL